MKRALEFICPRCGRLVARAKYQLRPHTCIGVARLSLDGTYDPQDNAVRLPAMKAARGWS